jgi:hypothetical protein
VHSAWRGQSFGGNFKAPNLAILKTARKSGDRKTVRSRTYWGEIQKILQAAKATLTAQAAKTRC